MRRKKIFCVFLAFILSLCCLIGISFKRYSDLSFFSKWYFIFTFIGVFLVFLLLFLFVFDRIEKIKISDIKNKRIKKIYNLFDKYPFLFSLIFIIICWIPYIIAFYPGILSPDPSFQILQFFGIDNKYSYYSVLLDPKVIITNHHPVIHTLLLGGCVKFGMLFNNFNLGLFTYSLIQTIILCTTLAYTISVIKKLNLSKKYSIICLLVYSLVPVFPFYAMSCVKDVIFTCLIILYIITIWKYIKECKFSLWNIILLVLIVLFRNNGFYVVILSLPFLLFIKGHRKKVFISFIATVLFFFSYNNYILPYFHITQTSPREALSIPFQQTARYVSEYGDEVSDKEKEVIDKILGYDTLSDRYDPLKADPVKNEYNRYASKKDLVNYFRIWFKEFLKHPIVYLEATLNNTYGYYSLDNNWYIYYNYSSILKKYGFDYHYNNMAGLRGVLIFIGVLFPYIPMIGLIVNIGFSTWVLLFMIVYLIYKKKYRYVVVYLPMVVSFLVCLASPVNTYFRYAMPNVFVMPLAFGVFLHIIKGSKS